MDAKSKANFINSVASRQKIPCPVCNELNEFDSRYCYMCGAQLINESANSMNNEVVLQKFTTTLKNIAKTYETEIKSESNINSAEKKDNTSTAFEPIKEPQMVNDNIEEKRSIKNTASPLENLLEEKSLLKRRVVQKQEKFLYKIKIRCRRRGLNRLLRLTFGKELYGIRYGEWRKLLLR